MDVVKYFDIGFHRQTNGDVGIEVEVEGRRLPRAVEGWGEEYDGSLLGNALEYVLKKPMTLDDAFTALDNLDQAYELSESEVKDTVRCGVHVHVNAQAMTIPQLYNYITLYSMFEGALLSYCGLYREGNLFCLPLNKSPLLIYKLRQVAVNGSFYELHSDEYRYCALNLKALGDYGSVEFRAMRGGRDLDRIKQWAKLLVHLRGIACKYKRPEEIIEHATDIGCIQFFLNTIGYPEVFQGVDNLKRKLSQGLSSAMPIAYACDWSKYIVEVCPYEDFY